mmetsp:Transcript_13023/g.51632  ORF Transcript_13023/g.51632 Transcript_13023/m.51632 type:complete len:151 (-) Transcript_13023:1304-1756(-)
MPFEAQKKRKANVLEGKEQRILFERDCDSRVVAASHLQQIPTLSRTDSQALKQLVRDQYLAYSEAPNLSEGVIPQVPTTEEQPVETDKGLYECSSQQSHTEATLVREKSEKSREQAKQAKEAFKLGPGYTFSKAHMLESPVNIPMVPLVT